MSNPFYNYSGNFIPGTLGRAETSQQEFQAVQAGFSLLVTEGVDSGVASAYVVTTSGQPTGAYADGNTVEFKPLFAPTGSATINVNSVGVVPLLRFNGAATQSGDFGAGQWLTATYNSLYSGFTIASPSAVVVYPGTISGAAPTHKVGLVAAGGVSTAAAPIDVTFAIDQSIVPTWTGAHTFTPVSGVAVTINGEGTAAAKSFQINGGGSNIFGAMDTTAATGGYLAFSNSGTQNAFIGLGAVVITGASLSDFCITPNAGVLRLGYNNGAATALSINSTGNVVVAAPSSGVALAVNGLANANTMTVTAPNTASQSYGFVVSAGTNSTDYAFYVRNAAASAIFCEILGDGSGHLGINVTNTLSWNASGAYSIAAPSSGIAFSVTGFASSYTAVINSAGSAGTQLGLKVVGTTANAADILLQANVFGVSNPFLVYGDGHGVLGYNGSGATITFAAAGNVTIAAPSSGSTLAMTGFASANAVTIAVPGTTGYGLQIAGTSGASVACQLFAVQQNGFSNGFTVSTDGTNMKYAFNNGNVTIGAPTSANALVVNGAASSYCTVVQTTSLSAGTSFGLEIAAGTNSSDAMLQVANQAGTVVAMKIFGDGGIVCNGATGGDEGAGTINVASGYYINGTSQFQTGTFTGTLTGCTTSPTATIRYVIVGNMCTLFFPTLTGTSNTTSATITGLPAVCQATTNAQAQPIATMEDNSNAALGGYVQIQTASGTMILALAESTAISNRVEYVQAGFTNSGTKGLGGGSITYSLI